MLMKLLASALDMQVYQIRELCTWIKGKPRADSSIQHQTITNKKYCKNWDLIYGRSKLAKSWQNISAQESLEE